MEVSVRIMWMMMELPNSDARNVTTCAKVSQEIDWLCDVPAMLVKFATNGERDSFNVEKDHRFHFRLLSYLAFFSKTKSIFELR